MNYNNKIKWALDKRSVPLKVVGNEAKLHRKKHKITKNPIHEDGGGGGSAVKKHDGFGEPNPFMGDIGILSYSKYSEKTQQKNVKL